MSAVDLDSSARPRPSIIDAYRTLQQAQKPGPGVPLYTRYVNRPLGRRVAAVAAATGVTANQVTLAGGGMSFAAMALLMIAGTSALTLVAVALLLVVAYVLDSADGQLARLTGTGGPAGEWLDHVVDAARTVGFHLTVAVAMFRHLDVSTGWVLMPLLFAVIAGTRFFALILAEQLSRGLSPAESAGGRRRSTAPAGEGWVRSFLQLPSDTGILNLSVLLLAAPAGFLAIYGALLSGNALLLAMSLRRRYRELALAGAPGKGLE